MLCAIIIERKRSGCSAVGSVLEWGSRGRKFESSHSDQEKRLETYVLSLFCFIFGTFLAGLNFAILESVNTICQQIGFRAGFFSFLHNFKCLLLCILPPSWPWVCRRSLDRPGGVLCLRCVRGYISIPLRRGKDLTLQNFSRD